MELLKTFLSGYANYAGYLWYEITHPGWHNYLYWLLLVSAFFFGMEWIHPWRKDQPRFRKDFWLDFFYMFFNFFLFSLVVYNAASDVVVKLFNDGIKSVFDFDLQASNPMQHWPMWAILGTGFLVRDFIQWWVHRLLHRVSFLWNFHKVHHSVQEMGFAAHLRYHWMENVVYQSIEYIPLALLGIGLHDFFIMHIFALSIGHYNHSNITVSAKTSGGVLGLFLGILIATGSLEITLLEGQSLMIKLAALVGVTALGYFVVGPFMKKIFNSPEMHIWHHAEEIPKDMPYGINFGISLAIWDYIFGTARMPHDGRDIKLGFEGIDQFPQDFVAQNKYGL